MKYYVVSDLHGFYTPFKNKLQEVGFFHETQPCKLILCGDLLDRGNEANELIDFMMQLVEEDKLIYILGNHEELFIECLQKIARGGVYDIAVGMSHHHSNGTWDTLLQISGMSASEACENPHELVRSCMRSPFYQKLFPLAVDYYETPHYIFTHGWIPCFADDDQACGPYHQYDPNWREADLSSWMRARWLVGIDMACKHHILEPNKTIVCGHRTASYGHSKIDHNGTLWGKSAIFSEFEAEGILAIDACTAESGQVNCIVIED